MSAFTDDVQWVCDQLNSDGSVIFSRVVRTVAEDAGRQERQWARETIKSLSDNATPFDVLHALDAAHRRRKRNSK